MEVIMDKTKSKYERPNLDSFTTIRSLASWDLHFAIPGMVNADKVIKPFGTIDMLNREIKLCCDNNNAFFVGTGQGSHARVYIEDDNMRVFVGFDSEDGNRKQNIISDEKCQKLFEYKTQSAFEKNAKDMVVTEHEKDYIMNYARKNKINDLEKVLFLEELTSKKYKI
jgi:hypothetical protein